MNLIKTFTLTATVLLLCSTAAQAAPASGQGTWETTLQARDLDGDGVTDAFYDTELNVTWLRDANANGRMTWDAAKTWASNLVVGGNSGWRLPTLVDTGLPGCNFAYTGTDCGYNVQTKSGSTVYSEMAHLYYTTLGNKAYCTPGDPACSVAQPGWGLSNTGNFQNLLSSGYVSGTGYAAAAPGGFNFGPSFDSNFGANSGFQGPAAPSTQLYALAVRPGDVTAAIPEPESYALALAGLTALVVVRRHRAKAALTR
jgi:hypothetical protein